MSFRSLAFSFRMGRSTVANIVMSTCTAIWELRTEFLPTPTREMLENIANEFMTSWNFPNVIGCLDGKHIRIKCPDNSGALYFNYKKYFSIVLQALAGPDYRFIFIDIGAYGKESDGGIFQRSELKKILDQNNFQLPTTSPNSPLNLPYVILGDAAYPLRTDLMTPYPTNLTHDRRIYNYRHSRARRCVEHAFGILASKWRVLKSTMELNVDNAQKAVLACVVLHNFLLQREAVIVDDHELWQEQVATPRPTFKGRPATYAAWIRDQFCDFFNGQGAVPWQEEKV